MSTDKNTRFRTLSLIGAISGLLLVGCSSGEVDTSAGSEEAITVTYGHTVGGANGPVFLAYEKGYFEEEGVDLQLEVVKSSAESLPLTAGGKLDISGVPTSAGFFNAFEQDEIASVVGSLASSPDKAPTFDPLVAVPEMFDGEEFVASRLEGEAFGLLGEDSYTEFSSSLALDKVGLTTDDVDMKSLTFPNLVAALSNGSVKAAWLSEPQVSRLEEDGIVKTVVDDHDLSHDQLEIVVNNDFAQENSEAIVGFLKAVIRAGHELSEDGWTSSEHASILAEYLDVEEEAVRNAPISHFRENAEVNEASIDAQQRYFAETGALNYEELMPIDDIVNDDYRQEALEQSK